MSQLMHVFSFAFLSCSLLTCLVVAYWWKQQCMHLKYSLTKFTWIQIFMSAQLEMLEGTDDGNVNMNVNVKI